MSQYDNWLAGGHKATCECGNDLWVEYGQAECDRCEDWTECSCCHNRFDSDLGKFLLCEDCEGLKRCKDCEEWVEEKLCEGMCKECVAEARTVECEDFDSWGEEEVTKEYSLTRVTQECPVIVDTKKSE